MEKYSFPLFQKFIFLLSYLFYKVTIFLETNKGVLRLYIAETIWTLNQLGGKIAFPDYFKTDFFITKFGRFFIIPDLISTITVSPAFERRDINYLISLIEKELKGRKKVLFIDIGANFGLYTIAIGNRFKKSNLDIVAFEPDASYITFPSYGLLRKNIKINNIKKIKTFKIGIGIKYLRKKNKEGFYTKPLHFFLANTVRKYDVVFIKMDVDDFVLDALDGIQKFVNMSKEAILLVEDVVDKRTVKYLEKHNYQFIKKLTFYNSFWQK